MSTNRATALLKGIFVIILTLATSVLISHTGVRAFAATKVLTVNNSTYVVGDQIVYVIKGAPSNSAIFWSSWKDGVPTGESDSSCGHRTDAFGNWSATVGPWTENLTGAWKKQARVGGQVYTVTFQVQPRPLEEEPPATPVFPLLAKNYWQMISGACESRLPE